MATHTPVLLETFDICKHFGNVKALQNVSMKLMRGQFHALLGENGAGKSTLVKCIMGYYQQDRGQLLLDGKEVVIDSPQQAARLGIGMVYQHFTLVPNMTVAENIVLAQPILPAVINWKTEIQRLELGMTDMPFKVNLQQTVASLSAGEKQKVEIVKQLFLNTRLLILDEPTSVLTPTEADEVLGKIHELTQTKDLTVLIITHKFREVTQFADHITVLRKGQFIASLPVAQTNETEMAELMIGAEVKVKKNLRTPQSHPSTKLKIENLWVKNEHGAAAVKQANLSVSAGEILGIAGVSGNGQKELLEALAGQRDIDSGQVYAHGIPFFPTRAQMYQHQFYCLPEEPLKNACVANLSIAQNLVLRQFDQTPFVKFKCLLNRQAIKDNAVAMIKAYGIRTSGPQQFIGDLSGGNVQRTVLAREITQNVSILVIANPCFGLDFKAVADIRGKIMEARNNGAAILLISEDLDEVLELSDRLLVISDGEFVYETTPTTADRTTIGQYMAGH